jgi:hypothetical protein
MRAKLLMQNYGHGMTTQLHTFEQALECLGLLFVWELFKI